MSEPLPPVTDLPSLLLHLNALHAQNEEMRTTSEHQGAQEFKYENGWSDCISSINRLLEPALPQYVKYDTPGKAFGALGTFEEAAELARSLNREGVILECPASVSHEGGPGYFFSVSGGNSAAALMALGFIKRAVIRQVLHITHLPTR